MPRNYAKEAEWGKKQYRRYQVHLKSNETEMLQKILEQKKLTYTEWVREKIKQDEN